MERPWASPWLAHSRRQPSPHVGLPRLPRLINREDTSALVASGSVRGAGSDSGGAADRMGLYVAATTAAPVRCGLPVQDGLHHGGSAPTGALRLHQWLDVP